MYRIYSNKRPSKAEKVNKHPALACVASVSVRFRSKEQGTRVKDRAVKTEDPLPLSFLLRNQMETLATQANPASNNLPLTAIRDQKEL